MSPPAEPLQNHALPIDPDLAPADPAEASERWSLAFPGELTVALRDAKGAELGGFAEGWQGPEMGYSPYDSPACIEDEVLLRWEFEDLDPDGLAIDVGDRVENAFGTTYRRHLARQGHYADKFDPRFSV